MNRAIKLTFRRGISLFAAILLVATVAPQILNIETAFAGDGYLWDDAATVNQSTYDWGYYPTCPTSDPNCMLLTGTLNGNTYGEADPWVFNLRNCTSYVAYKINQVFGISIPSSWGDAKDWDSHATGPGNPYTNDPSPQIGDIAQWTTGGGGHGHVAYVFNVVNGVAYYDEYNYAGTGAFTNTGTSSTEGAPTNWIHIGAVPSANPGLGGGAGSTWASGRLDAWVEQAQPTGSSNLGHIWYDGAWHPWENIPNNQLMTSQPAAVSWGLNRIDVFARGQAGDLIHQWYNGTSWSNWESLGGCIVGQPTVTSWGPNELDVFAEGCSTVNGSNLVHTWYNSVGWNAWETVDSNMLMTSAPSAVAWVSGRIDIFAQGPNQNLIHTWYNSAGWNNWENLGGCVVGAPAASSWGPNRLDGWVEGCNTTGGNFYHIFWDGSKWNPFELVNSTYQISGVFGAVSWGYPRIDMFTRASDNSLDHWWYNTAGWNGPENKGGAIAP